MKYNKFIFNDSSIRKRIIIINGFMSSLIFIILLSLSILILFKIILFISFLPIVKLLILNIFIKSSIELNEKNILIKVSNITIKCEVNDIKELIIAKNGIGIIFHDIDNIISNAVINKLSLWEKLVLPLLYIPFSWRRPDKFFQNENNIKKFFRNHYNITGAHFICSVSLSEEDLIDIERLYFNNKLLKISKEDSIYARKPISFVEPKITLLTFILSALLSFISVPIIFIYFNIYSPKRLVGDTRIPYVMMFFTLILFIIFQNENEKFFRGRMNEKKNNK